ncbi:MAG: DNA cytosine methyltransferase [Clostridia bacterium]|nr:DNA cytosine methyltransferase [Clostridia bacterium]
MPQHRTRTYIVAFHDEAECAAFMFPEKQELKKRITDVIDRTQKAPDEYYYSPGTTKYERLNSFIKDADQLYRFSDYGIQASKDGIAFTLKANMGTWHDRVPIVKDNFGIRRITPEECLALQSFPDSFSFPNDIPPASKYKQAGNTVCVSLIQAIASKIRQLNKQVSEKSTFGL